GVSLHVTPARHRAISGRDPARLRGRVDAIGETASTGTRVHHSRDAVARLRMTIVPAHAHSSITRGARAGGTRRAGSAPSGSRPAGQAARIASPGAGVEGRPRGATETRP